MIQSFRDEDTRGVFDGSGCRRWASIERVARRKLDQMEAASALDELRVPPGDRLEALKGNREGQYSIRINDQYRICFEWQMDGAYGVEIADYH